MTNSTPLNVNFYQLVVLSLVISAICKPEHEQSFILQSHLADLTIYHFSSFLSQQILEELIDAHHLPMKKLLGRTII